MLITLSGIYIFFSVWRSEKSRELLTISGFTTFVSTFSASGFITLVKSFILMSKSWFFPGIYSICETLLSWSSIVVSSSKLLFSVKNLSFLSLLNRFKSFLNLLLFFFLTFLEKTGFSSPIIESGLAVKFFLLKDFCSILSYGGRGPLNRPSSTSLFALSISVFHSIVNSSTLSIFSLIISPVDSSI